MLPLGVLALLSLLACDPVAPEQRAEAVFYDANRLESELGIRLVEVPDGEPLRHTIRMVIRADRIEIDNRAWWLEVARGSLWRRHLAPHGRGGLRLDGPGARAGAPPSMTLGWKPARFWAASEPSGSLMTSMARARCGRRRMKPRSTRAVMRR